MLAVPKKPGAASAQIAIRLDPSLLEEADALIDYVTEKQGIPATRMAVLREAVVRGLRAMSEARRKGNMGKKIDVQITGIDDGSEADHDSLAAATCRALEVAYPGADVTVSYSETSRARVRVSDGIDEHDVKNIVQDAWADWCSEGEVTS